jgi:cytochrome P450
VGPVPPEGAPEPAEVDIDAYLKDAQSELARCARFHWFAEGLNLQGEPMPWVLHYDAVRSTLRDRRLSPRSFVDDMLAAGITPRTAEQFTPLFRRDGEEHRQHRALLSAAFTPRSVEQMRPVAQTVAERLADDLAAAGEPCPFVATFAAPLPAEVFAVLFGLPPEDRDRLGRWAASVSRAFAPLLDADAVAEVEQAGAELREYCSALMDRRRREPADDLITRLLDAEVDGHRLDDDEVIAVMSGFIFAGSETTRRQLTVMLAAFAERPAEWERVAADPELIAGAVEEVLRHRPIVPGLTRVAVDDYRHHGDAPGKEIELDPGERLMVSFLTANRDPQHFEHPDRFDIERENAGDHVTFGWGPHFCMGAGLARVELQEALRVLSARFGPPRLIGEPVLSGPGFAAPDELLVAISKRG